MSIFKKIDNNLMWFLTIHNNPKWFKTPFSQFLFAVLFNVFAAMLLNVWNFLDGIINWFNHLTLSIFFISIIYQWKLWRQLENEAKQNL